MAKKKKRKRWLRKREQRRLQKQRRANRQQRTEDTHHLCWIRRKWEVGVARELRNYWYCKMTLPRQTIHREIHRELKDIPVPTNEQARYALGILRMLETEGKISPQDTLEKRLWLLITLFDGTPTGEGFKQQLSIVQNYHPSE